MRKIIYYLCFPVSLSGLVLGLLFSSSSEKIYHRFLWLQLTSLSPNFHNLLSKPCFSLYAPNSLSTEHFYQMFYLLLKPRASKDKFIIFLHPYKSPLVFPLTLKTETSSTQLLKSNPVPSGRLQWLSWLSTVLCQVNSRSGQAPGFDHKQQLCFFSFPPLSKHVSR